MSGEPQDDAHRDRGWLDQVLAAIIHRQEDPYAAATRSISGSGAIADFEAAFSALHADRPAFLVPSATYGLRVALQAVGVRPGSEVILPVIDWSSSFQAVQSLGAVPVPVAVRPDTATLCPDAAAAGVTARTAAIIACDLHGIAADLPALRAAVPHLPLVEDAAGALGSSLAGVPVGTGRADVTVFSLGPGKQLDAGEGGVVLCRDHDVADRVLRNSAHPTRLALAGFDDHELVPEPGSLMMRPHPAAALVGLHLLASWNPAELAARHAARARDLRTRTGIRLLGAADRTNTAALVPVLSDEPGSGCGSYVLPASDPDVVAEAERLLARIRLVPVAN